MLQNPQKAKDLSVSLMTARQEGACRVLATPEHVSEVQLSHSSRRAIVRFVEACRSVDFYTLLQMAFKEPPLPRFSAALYIPFLEPRETKSLSPVNLPVNQSLPDCRATPVCWVFLGPLMNT